MAIKLLNQGQVIRVRVKTDGCRNNLIGQVVGSYNGEVTILLNSGEYVDIPENRLQIIENQEMK